MWITVYTQRKYFETYIRTYMTMYVLHEHDGVDQNGNDLSRVGVLSMVLFYSINDDVAVCAGIRTDFSYPRFPFLLTPPKRKDKRKERWRRGVRTNLALVEGCPKVKSGSSCTTYLCCRAYATSSISYFNFIMGFLVVWVFVVVPSSTCSGSTRRSAPPTHGWCLSVLFCIAILSARTSRRHTQEEGHRGSINYPSYSLCPGVHVCVVCCDPIYFGGQSTTTYLRLSVETWAHHQLRSHRQAGERSTQESFFFFHLPSVVCSLAVIFISKIHNMHM